MCNHVFCLPCIIKTFNAGQCVTYLEECPVCRKTFFFVPRAEEHLNAIATRFRARRGMQIAPVESANSRPFDKYLI